MFSEGPPVADIAKSAAAQHARADRERFLGVLKVAERFVADNGRVIGGKGGRLMLQGGREEVPLDAYHLLVYTPEPYKDAKQLAKLVYAVDPQGLTQFTVALPRVNSASVNTAQREVVSFRSLPFFRGVHIYKLIPPDPRPALFSKGTLPCLGPEVQLLDLYADLCNPGLGKDWAALAEEEKAVRAIFLREYKKKFAAVLANVVGGRPKRAAVDGPQVRKRLGKLLREEFLFREGRVWLGAPAGGGAQADRLACASVFSFENEKETIEQLAKKAGGAVHFLVNHPQIIVDTRLRRLTVYLQGARREPVLDIYNVAQYEAVPYLHALGDGGTPYKLGTAYARARFLLVDIWTIQLIWRMGQISDGFAEQQVSRLLKQFQNLKALDSPDDAFPAKAQHFVGRIEDPIRADRRAVAAARADERHEKGKPGKAGRSKPHRPVPFYPGRFDGPNQTQSA